TRSRRPLQEVNYVFTAWELTQTAAAGRRSSHNSTGQCFSRRGFRMRCCPFIAAAPHLRTGGLRSVVGYARVLEGINIMETSAIEFRAKWYVVERAFLDAAALSFFHRHALALANSSTIALGDAQVADAPVAYGDPNLDTLLETVRGRVEHATGFRLLPTY